MRAVLPQGGLLDGGRHKAVTRHSNIVSVTADIFRGGEATVLPGSRSGVCVSQA
jgi:hypothetical protein